MNVMLDVVGLDVRYGSSQVLFGLKLQVHQGETLALLGRNGAGKSTSMKADAIIKRLELLRGIDNSKWKRILRKR
jgi:ABC-type branched-subunit amino acid transport system ATPase component